VKKKETNCTHRRSIDHIKPGGVVAVRIICISRVSEERYKLQSGNISIHKINEIDKEKKIYGVSDHITTMRVP